MNGKRKNAMVIASSMAFTLPSFLQRTKNTVALTDSLVIAALQGVQGSAETMVQRISGIKIQEGKVSFVITLSPEMVKEKAEVEKACEQAVLNIPGVKQVSIIVTAEKPVQPTETKRAVWNTNPIPEVAKIIAISSGKGGVGKSTTAVNLARALVKRGFKVGLLDGDIYGPSLPKMLGIQQKPEIVDNKIIPLNVHGLKCISIGFLVGEDSAIIWRGPQATKALHQMLRDVAWGELDYLLIDMPPGTGDIHLSLVQQVPVNGAVIVTTPQEVALADARKSIDMFAKVNVPIIGIIENMSGFTDPDTGKTHFIFGEGGGHKLAEQTQSPYLGSVAIDMELRIASDNGTEYTDTHHVYHTLSLQL